MTDRLYPSTNGPASSTSFTGSIVQGMVFGITSASQYLYGYYYWRSDSSQPDSASFGLWQLTGQLTGTYLGSSTFASISGMTIGAWNFAPLATPFALSTGVTYKAVSGQLNNFNFTSGYWTGSHVGGVITAYGDTGVTGHDPNFNSPQATFTTGSSDPTATFPTTANSSYNFWIDLSVGPLVAGGSTPGPIVAPSAAVMQAANW